MDGVAQCGWSSRPFPGPFRMARGAVDARAAAGQLYTKDLRALARYRATLLLETLISEFSLWPSILLPSLLFPTAQIANLGEPHCLRWPCQSRMGSSSCLRLCPTRCSKISPCMKASTRPCTRSRPLVCLKTRTTEPYPKRPKSSSKHPSLSCTVKIFSSRARLRSKI